MGQRIDGSATSQQGGDNEGDLCADADMVARQGCIICSRPAELHHVRRNGRLRARSPVIPLCPEHHRIGGHGVAVHAGRRSFEAAFGSEYDLLNKVKQR